MIEDSKSFHPEILKSQVPLRSHQLAPLQNLDWDNLFPLSSNCGVGFDFGVFKGNQVQGASACGCVCHSADVDLTAVRLIEAVRAARLNEWEQELAAQLQLSSGPAAAPRL